MRQILSNVTLLCVDTRPDITGAEYAIKQCTDRFVFAEAKLLTSKELPHVNSYRAYSEFMLKELHQYFNTDFVLTVQHDGYIVNQDAWTNEFLDYDYIGAAWGNYAAFPEMRVGNGGFSLRSKRLCKLVSDKLEIPNDDVILEDHLICRVNRKLLEAQGIKFAPVSIAEKFSAEGGRYIPNTFGFHGSHALNVNHVGGGSCAACQITKRRSI